MRILGKISLMPGNLDRLPYWVNDYHDPREKWRIKGIFLLQRGQYFWGKE